MAAGWKEFLAERPIAVLATVGPDGFPHAVPVEVLVRNDKVYLWCRSGSVKARNAVLQGRAAVVAYKGHAGVLVRGTIRLLRPEDAGYDEVTQGFLDKYRREETYGNDLVIEVAPDRVAGWT